LVRRLGDRYERLLADYRRLLRASFEDVGGLEVDTQGDAFFIVFARANSAVSAAVEAQRSLATNAWPDGVEVKVRMGITTGEPSIGEEGFVGLPVHRGARICAAAHGGQVLLAGGTRELVEDLLPDDVRLRDLGQHQLKDLERPERIFQLLIDGLPSEFPAARTVLRKGAPETPFAGKEALLAARAGVLTGGRGRLNVLRGLRLGVIRPGRSRRVLGEALWRTLMQPITVLVLCALLLAAIFLQPWIAAVAFAFYSWRVLATARGLWFLHGLEWMGMRVRALMDFVSDEALRDRLRKLAGAMVDASRLAVVADDQLRAANRKELGARLQHYRGSLALSPAELREADSLASKVGVLDELAARRQALDEGSDALEARVDALRDQIFEARRDPSLAPQVAAEAEALWDRVEERRRGLLEAVTEANRLVAGSPTPRRVINGHRRPTPSVAAPPPSPSVPTAIAAVRPDAEAGTVPFRGRGRQAQWRCFWRWPFGHTWEPVTEGNIAFLRCHECGRAIDRGFRAPTSTLADRWRPGGEG
jgi:hypothetical protein